MTNLSFDTISRRHRELQASVRKLSGRVEAADTISVRNIRSTPNNLIGNKKKFGPSISQKKTNTNYLSMLKGLRSSLANCNNLLDELKQGSFDVSLSAQAKINKSLEDLKRSIISKIGEITENLSEQGSKHSDAGVISLVGNLFKSLEKRLNGLYKDAYVERLISNGVDETELFRISHYLVFEELKDDNNYEWPKYYFVITEIHYVKGLGNQGVHSFSLFANTFGNVKPLANYKLGSKIENDKDALRAFMQRLKLDNFKDVLDPKAINMGGNPEEFHGKLKTLLPGTVKSSSIKDNVLTVIFGPSIRSESSAKASLNDVAVALKKTIKDYSPRNKDTFVFKTTKRGNFWTGSIMLQPLYRGTEDTISQQDAARVGRLLNLNENQLHLVMDALRQGQ